MLKKIIRPSTELYLGSEILHPDLLLPFGRTLRVVLVVDETIRDLYGVDLAKRIGATLLSISSGEKGKTLKRAEELIDQLSRMGCGRDTLLIAMGGGVTTDLAAFAASIYLRGIPLILIPTTLLAIVDAAIGGKTGVDTLYGKNQIGTIYPPKAIFADLSLLKTLPEKERLNGLAEILKMGLIRDPLILEMDRNDPRLIERAIDGKIGVVEQDPTERSLRRILNFGHTIGHALEAVADYEIPHGEAVAIGSLAEAHLSMRLGYLPREEFERIEELYRPFSLRLPKNYSRKSLLSAMAHDKKNEKGKIRFVLIDRIGHPLPFDGAYCLPVDQTELEPTLEWMEK